MPPQEIPDELIDQLLAGVERPEDDHGPGWVAQAADQAAGGAGDAAPS